MEPSPAPHESPVKGEDKRGGEPGSLSRFKALARILFATDTTNFKEVLEKDKAERRAKRGP